MPRRGSGRRSSGAGFDRLAAGRARPLAAQFREAAGPGHVGSKSAGEAGAPRGAFCAAGRGALRRWPRRAAVGTAADRTGGRRRHPLASRRRLLPRLAPHACPAGGGGCGRGGGDSEIPPRTGASLSGGGRGCPDRLGGASGRGGAGRPDPARRRQRGRGARLRTAARDPRARRTAPGPACWRSVHGPILRSRAGACAGWRDATPSCRLGGCGRCAISILPAPIRPIRGRHRISATFAARRVC